MGYISQNGYVKVNLDKNEQWNLKIVTNSELIGKNKFEPKSRVKFNYQLSKPESMHKSEFGHK